MSFKFLLILILLKVISNNDLKFLSDEVSEFNLTKEFATLTQLEKDNYFMNIAVEEAINGLREGGVPIGSIIVKDDKIIGRGHNLRVQTNSPILHGEMSALQNAGRLTAKEYKDVTLYTTLSPCQMCSATIHLYKIKRIIIGEDKNFKDYWGQDFLQQLGHDVEVVFNEKAYSTLKKFIEENPDLWNEDIGK